MKDLITNRLEVKAETLDAKSTLESLPMLIKEFDVDEFNIKQMSATAAIFTFTTKAKPPRDMIRTISKDHKNVLFLLEYKKQGFAKNMYLVKNGEVLTVE